MKLPWRNAMRIEDIKAAIEKLFGSDFVEIRKNHDNQR
jgi:hypothetical protein